MGISKSSPCGPAFNAKGNKRVWLQTQQCRDDAPSCIVIKRESKPMKASTNDVNISRMSCDDEGVSFSLR